MASSAIVTGAVVEWTFSGGAQGHGGRGHVPRRLRVSARGESPGPPGERPDPRRETDYYDLRQMQQQIAAAGGTPGRVGALGRGRRARRTGASTTAAERTGSVTIRVYACPAEMGQAAGQGQLDQAELLAGVHAPRRSRDGSDVAHASRW